MVAAKRLAKGSLLTKLQANVAIVAAAFPVAEQQLVGVVGIFIADCQGGVASANELHEAIEEFNDIGKVVREDFFLRFNYREKKWVVESIQPFNDSDSSADHAALTDDADAEEGD